MNEYFSKIDDKLGLKKYKKACSDEWEMVLDCVLASNCFRKHKHFKYCIQDGIDKDCKALRYNLFLCKRS